MPTEFVVHGPIEIPTDGSGRTKFITAACRREFLASDDFHPLMMKHGVYVFALKTGRGSMPWYVGRTNGKKGMHQECMAPHKVLKYNEAMRKSNGTPVFYFVVRPATRRIAPAPLLRDMERQLTQDALARNPRIMNIHNTKNLPNWHIKGVLRSGQGKPSATESAFRRLMGI